MWACKTIYKERWKHFWLHSVPPPRPSMCPPLPRDPIPNVDSPERSHPSVQYSTAWLPGLALWDALNFIWSYVATFKGAIYQISKCSGEQDFPIHIPPKLKICSNLKKTSTSSREWRCRRGLEYMDIWRNSKPYLKRISCMKKEVKNPVIQFLKRVRQCSACVDVGRMRQLLIGGLLTS